MAYDILQLNDMIVPELQDIAEKLQITDLKNLGKQDLVYRILDQQALKDADGTAGEEPKKKRGRKPKESVAKEETAAPADVAEPQIETKQVIAAPTESISGDNTEKPARVRRERKPVSQTRPERVHTNYPQPENEEKQPDLPQDATSFDDPDEVTHG